MGTDTRFMNRCDAALRDIEATRRRIDDKADVLRERLKPRSMFRPLTDRLKDTLGEGGEKMLDTFREHPVPVALTGLGLGWLILSDLRRERAARAHGTAGEGMGEAVKEKVGEVRAAAGEAVERTKEKVQGAARRIREGAAAVPGKMKQGARKASDWFSETLEENPMLMALGALAAGLAAGLSMPASAREEESAGGLAEKAAAALDEGKEAIGKGEPAPAAGPGPSPILGGDADPGPPPGL